MSRVAVFVDAGYLYAAGSIAIHGGKLHREKVTLNLPEAVRKLTVMAGERTDGKPLLRVYWYDGALPRGLSSEQQSLADADDVKLRLGIVTFGGQQKGVDSLIVTDLVELARNRAISDAVLMSGDEDVRIGVQIAQSFGVRVHLLGIEPSRVNQSRALIQESDTTTEWSVSDIGDILTVKTRYAVARDTEDDALGVAPETAAALDEATADLIAALAPGEIRLIADLDRNDFIPKEYDVRLLHIGSERTGARLSLSESIYIRSRLKAAARDSASAAESGSDSDLGG